MVWCTNVCFVVHLMWNHPFVSHTTSLYDIVAGYEYSVLNGRPSYCTVPEHYLFIFDEVSEMFKVGENLG